MTALHPSRTHGKRNTAPRMVISSGRETESSHFVIPRTGITFAQQLTYEKWLGIGRQLATVSASSAWCLGDWLIYGENAYSGRYRNAIEQTSLDYQTLRNYAWVARRFPLSRRRETLSFAHHAEVARLPEHEQDFWLRKADEFSWSRNRLRKELRASMAERSTAAATPGADSAPAPVAHSVHPARDSMQIRVQLSPEQLQSCQAVAEMLGHSVEEWAARALERAAEEELSRSRHSRRRAPAGAAPSLSVARGLARLLTCRRPRAFHGRAGTSSFRAHRVFH
jgi:hypothetical protein